MLKVEGLCVSYGPVRAVSDVGFEVRAGEILALIGPNGAGKTTTLKAIAGVLPFTGRIEFDGAPLRPGRAEERPGQGLCLVPEGRGILARMTVHENLLMGGYCRKGGAPDKEINAVYERFPVLQERNAVPAGLLSGGEQQMLAIGRALLAKPRLLMLDEPSLGLAPLMVERVFGIVKDLRAAGITILIIEQKARQTLAIADRACVLETGRIVVTDEAARLAGDAALARAYLGTGAK
ncbi:MAG: ABC transporter ATP-binding protein [Betaproteobacteria bacterium]|jgi:branched-chain amino acid transport system ATP-binding protein|nr:ABC transporter ATP-binding protein [Betaproteobacteria bacterium]